jgi:2-haloacid dehalogenase
VNAPSVKALFFDVFGTLVDWRGGIAREAESILASIGHKLDWLAFADAWRDQYQPAMEEVRTGRIPFCKLDVLHRHNLDRILPQFGVSHLREDAARDLNLAWHRLDGWPDAASGLACLRQRCRLAPVSNGNISLMVDLARRNNFPWDAILGAGRLQAQAARLSRRLRGARPAARRLHDGRGPHQRSRCRRQMRAAHGPHRATERARAGHG